MDEEAQFEVTNHFELPERGAFVVGHIRNGTFRIGMIVEADPPDSHLTISGIEYVDNIKEKRFWNALRFREQPSLETVKRRFPVGTVLKAKREDSSQ
jgi:hypothetical protein